MKNMKKFTALTLGAVMAVSMAAGVSAAQTVASKDDLAGATIGVQLGTTGDLEASEYEKDGSTVERYSKGSEAVQALKAGQVDCVIIDSQPAQKFVENAEGLKILDDPFVEEEYAICLKKGNDELLEKINGALKELKEDGTVDSIMANYIGDAIGETPYESPEDVDRSNGTLVMATNAEFEPYEYHEGDDIVGIDVDIAQAICDKLGYELKIEDMEFDAILAAVQSGKADFGAAGMTVTEDRLESVDFTETYANASQVIIVNE
ncbi:transporter substrate-binding domain-containing protein [Ruminococcus sp. 5_1_39BFAA]|uniref:transporter substrate-binding domain-containing protein n=1 Tax=Ruminococcus sp. 5_1_39BFAA TaxID=457412 RepID=UPI003569C307